MGAELVAETATRVKEFPKGALAKRQNMTVRTDSVNKMVQLYSTSLDDAHKQRASST